MYLRHFGFDQAPFSITPDHRFVYLSSQHEESLAHLVYGIQRGGGAGFVLLTGEVGTGKTTISRLLLEQAAQPGESTVKIALILNPRLSPVELLESILRELGIPLRGTRGQLNRMVERLNDYLLKTWAEGQNTVVLIDEAQNLPPETLEQLRLLTNLETDTHKLLQVILIGQPELRDTLRRNDLRQLAQRITARYHLRELDADDTAAYLAHRCQVAGAKRNPFSPGAAKAIHRHAGGIPRVINTLADRALLVAWNANNTRVTRKYVKQAAAEVLDPAISNKRPRSAGYMAIATILATGLAVAAWYWLPATPEHASQTTSATALTQPPAQATASSPFQWPDTLQAWRQYAALWGSHASGWDAMQCPPAEATGMACLRRQGNLTQILRLNRPVVLQTTDPDALVVLEKTNPQGQFILKDSTEQPVSVNKSWLERHWLGTYYVLWPMPAALLQKTLPAPGSSEVTTWAHRLARQISGLPLNNETQFIDWLKRFQARHGLLADGIIGPETAMALSLKAYTGPTLQAVAPETGNHTHGQTGE